jgi:hypothetical protein
MDRHTALGGTRILLLTLVGLILVSCGSTAPVSEVPGAETATPVREVSLTAAPTRGIEHIPPATDQPEHLPLYVALYYHVEPNPQLFESVQPGYFEALSGSVRQMSSDLAGIDVSATFCFAWLYNDLIYCRNHDRQSGEVVNSDSDSGIETYQQVVADAHELAYHTHPANALRGRDAGYYARPDAACEAYDEQNAHRWSGQGADYRLEFQPGMYQFDEPDDPWYGEFTWERTSESLFSLADFLGATVRHANGGQRPMLDLTNGFGQGVNHPHSLQQLQSMMRTGFDLISPEVMYQFNLEYESSGSFWRDPSTGYVSYFGPADNVQVYYPDVRGNQIDRPAPANQGLSFMPVHIQGQAAWSSRGERDSRYYDPAPQGGTGGGGVRWDEQVFYREYSGFLLDPWSGERRELPFSSLAGQFDAALQRHLRESPESVNAWGFNHHIVNVMWADLSGLSDNWGLELLFLRDIADGAADGEVNLPRPDLVQFVTMQELSGIYDAVSAGAR